MDYSLASQHSQVLQVVRSGVPVCAGMTALIDWCEVHSPDSVWDHLRSLDYASEVPCLQGWVESVLTEEPPADEIQAFWFGLFETIEPGDVTGCVLYLCGSPRFQVGASDWACWREDTYLPRGRYAPSGVLGTVRRLLSGGADPVQDVGAYTLCLGYAALAVSALCRLVNRDLFLGTRKSREVVVGWDSGDWVVLDPVERVSRYPGQQAMQSDSG